MREREPEGLGKGSLLTSAGGQKERSNCREGELESEEARAAKWGRRRARADTDARRGRRERDRGRWW